MAYSYTRGFDPWDFCKVLSACRPTLNGRRKTIVTKPLPNFAYSVETIANSFYGISEIGEWFGNNCFLPSE